MAFPTPQGVSSSTFQTPPLDGSLTLIEVFDFHAAHSPDHPLFQYEALDGVKHTIVWSTAVQAFHAAARLVQQYLPKAPESGPPQVISILAAADSITYFALIAGIMRAGYQAFPISPRNSDVAIAHLLKSTASGHLFVSADPAMQKLAKAASEIFTPEGSNGVELFPMPTFETLFSPADTTYLPPLKKVDIDRPAVIMHSSGSTAFPKPIVLTYRALLQSGVLPCYGESDLCGEVLSSHAVPMFHLMGVVQLPWTAYSGLTIAVFPPISPPAIPTPDRVFEAAIATNCTLVFCVPAFLESWARNASRLAALQKFKTLIFAGGPLQPSVGDMLVENGVNIVPLYGLTETGTVTLFLPKQPPKEGWDYFRFSSHCDPVCVPLEDQEGVYHLVMKECASHTPAIINTVVDGVRALNTNDLLTRHPTNPELWKVFGRHDDQIMHSTGEKTNPIPIEAILLKNPKITSAIMFGRGKFHAGVLIVPDEPFEPRDLARLAEYRNAIWPTVEQANSFAPTHSRIFKEMILVANPSKPFELTAKGTPRRHVVLDAYANEIRDAYTAVEESSQVHLKPPSEFTPASILAFIHQAIGEVMPKAPRDDEDIFQNGCDSLQATWLRNTILHAVRQSSLKTDTRTIPHNFVYAHPTIRRLADYMLQLSEASNTLTESIPQKISSMTNMVQKYTVDFPRHLPSNDNPREECVFLTGTTGALGSYILKPLLLQPGITSIFALNRRNPKNQSSIQERQKTAFQDLGIDVDLVNSAKLRLLEGDLNSPSFGLSTSVYEEIHTKVTTIIHNAWSVDFNTSLLSMEPLISGTRRLIDFALLAPHATPRRFTFISSAAAAGWAGGGDTILEEPIINPATAIGSGYGESKWVAECILDKASECGLSPVIVRPGQLSGGDNGGWNTKEWFPALVRSCQVFKCIPTISGRISWIPISRAAAFIVEMRTSKERYVHIAHPNPIPMSLVLQPLSTILEVPLVPYARWLTALEAAALERNIDVKNPAVHLLDFFRSKQNYAEATSDTHETMFGTSLATNRAVASVPSLKLTPALDSKDVQEWVTYWRRIRFLD